MILTGGAPSLAQHGTCGGCRCCWRPCFFCWTSTDCGWSPRAESVGTRHNLPKHPRTDIALVSG